MWLVPHSGKVLIRCEHQGTTTVGAEASHLLLPLQRHKAALTDVGILRICRMVGEKRHDHLMDFVILRRCRGGGGTLDGGR